MTADYLKSLADTTIEEKIKMALFHQSVMSEEINEAPIEAGKFCARKPFRKWYPSGTKNTTASAVTETRDGTDTASQSVGISVEPK